MSEQVFFVADVAQEIQMPEKGILSQTLLQREAVKVVLFAFAAGEELSEHTASRPAILHVLDGGFEVQLGEARHDCEAGAWMYMPAGLPHSLKAKSPSRLMLYLLS